MTAVMLTVVIDFRDYLQKVKIQEVKIQEVKIQESDNWVSDCSARIQHVRKKASHIFAADSGIGSAPQTTSNLSFTKYEQAGVCLMASLKRYF